MKEYHHRREPSFPMRLQLSFIALVLLIMVAAIFLALWLVRRQLDRQAWAQLEQGAVATEALYEAQQRSLAGWARLLAERPTLRTLLAEGEVGTLDDYLATFREEAPLDCVFVCDAGQQVVTQTGAGCPASMATLCIEETPQTLLLDGGAPPTVLLTVVVPLVDTDGAPLWLKPRRSMRHALTLPTFPSVLLR